MYFLLFYTVLGYQVRAVGQNETAAKVAGINVSRNIIITMLISGGSQDWRAQSN